MFPRQRFLLAAVWILHLSLKATVSFRLPLSPSLLQSEKSVCGRWTALGLRRNSQEDGDDGGMEFLDDEEDDDGNYGEADGGNRSRPRQRQRPPTSPPLKKKSLLPQSGAGLNRWEILNRAVVAGVFVAGIGTGVTIDSAINTNPKDLASRDAIDKNAPNPKLCAAYGSSAMVLDERVFITFNPFNVYVTQADTKPGCVLRPSNVVAQLQKERKLISDSDVEACKNGYNTWAFVGDIDDRPQLNCVFQSDDAQNEFLSNPKVGLGEDIYDAQGNTNPKPSSPSSAAAGGGGVDASKPATRGKLADTEGNTKNGVVKRVVQQQVARLRPNQPSSDSASSRER